jgi:CoA:oxalate CoA-transferase
MNDQAGPLTGVTVIDITAGLAGPYATFLLAGMGARVIKIERPDAAGIAGVNRSAGPFIGRDGISMVRKHPDDLSLIAMQRLRGVESLSLDLKNPASRSVLRDLVLKAEILVQNLSRGAAARLGAGYDDIIAINPRIVYTSISGTGQDDKTGGGKTIDTVAQAMSGFMMTSGIEGEPPMRNGVPLADLITPLYAVIGTLAALTEARATGKGTHVDVSMLGALTTLVANEVFNELAFLGFKTRTGPTVPRLSPLGVYPSADGYVAVCTASDVRFKALAAAMGQPALAHDPRFATRIDRIRNSDQVDAIVSDWSRTKPAAEVADILDRVGIPSGPVRSVGEALRDPRGLARGDVVPMTHPVYGATHEVIGPGVPIKFGSRRYTGDATMPSYGQHTDSILSELLGYDTQRVATLKQAGAV